LNLRLFALIGLHLIVCGASISEAHEIVDVTGTHLTFVDHPQRIVTLAPSLAELAADFLGIDLQRIVGVTESTDYPPALKNVSSVGQYQRLNLEKIISLKPDLVLATEDGNSKDQIDHLREVGVPVLVLNTNHFSEIEASMKTVATVLGVSDQSLITHFEKRIAEFRARGEKRTPKKRVLIELDDEPLVVAGGRSFLNDALQLVGAQNIYADSDQGYPRPSKEDVSKKDPDVILVPTFGTEKASYMKKAEQWLRFPDLKAVKTKNVKVIFGDPLLRPSMRLLEGLAILEKAIYGTS
jgi:iron complex transport system substrate-binding protein